ncbi:MAG TPA: catalase family peroxidase [Roseiarcus sp.]|jgi:catalase
MPDAHPQAPPGPEHRYDLAALLIPANLRRLGLIGVLVLAIAALFAWTGGWLSSGRLDQTAMINRFEEVNGKHPGFRRNHAKGVCFSGWFDSNGAGVRLSKASVFRPGRVPIFGRFALAGGMPAMPDGPAAVRSMAVNFSLPDGEVWRTGMNDIPVFVVRDAQEFYDQLLATRPDPNTGKPDPARVAAFLATHPETAHAISVIKEHPFSSGFSNATYNSLDAFRFIDAAGKSTPVRWSMTSVDAFAPESTEPSHDPNALFDALAARLGGGPAQWRLLVTVGQPQDPTNDATIPWPAEREHVDVGTLTVQALQAEAPGNCRDINFDPLVLPSGIEPSDDPLLSARSAAYSVSFTRRAGEPKTPSAVQPGKGS